MVNERHDILKSKAEELGVQGLMILATEGVNATLSSLSFEALETFKKFVSTTFGIHDLFFKDSVSSSEPFKRFGVRLRDEIVTLERPDLVPSSTDNSHLSPKEFNQKINQGAVVLDTRNSYEIEIGKFKGAIDPGLKEFSQFPEYLKSAPLDKEKEVLIYCTGGIRCEKAILEMQNQGFKKVFQLDGGILNYLHELPNENFEGECFVFDNRLAVDQNLQATKNYKFCPFCGQAAATLITCKMCAKPGVVCEKCLSDDVDHHSCSKNCCNHLKMKRARGLVN
jgi:UPF0176 protein